MSGALSEDDIIDIANNEGLPGYQLLAVADKENSGDNSVSGKGARGRFQLLPATFKSVHPDGNIDDPRDNAVAAARYLKQGLDKNDQDLSSAAGYYYAGPGFKSKIQKAPGTKYGTNPDGSGGISIEDYQKQTVQNAQKYTGDTTDTTVVAKAGGGGTASFDADSLNAEIAKLSLQGNARLEQAGVASDSLSSALAKNIQAAMANVTEDGELQAKITMDAWGQKAKQAGQHAEELTRLGINEDDLDSTMARASIEMNEKYTIAHDMREQIRQKQSVGFFDSPIDFIANAMTLPGDVRKHNALIEDIAANKQYLDQASQVAQEVHAANAGKFTAVSYEGALATAQVQRNKASLDAIKLQDAMLRTDYDTQVRAFDVVQKRLSFLSQLESRASNQELRQNNLDQKTLQLEKQKMDDMQVNLAGKMIGLNIPDRKTLDKWPNKDAKQAVDFIMANDGKLGNDPFNTYQVLKRGNPETMPLLTRQQYGILGNAYSQAQLALNSNPEMKVAKREVQGEFIGNKMREALDLAASDPNYTGLKNNPYKVPSLDTMRQLPGNTSLQLIPLMTQFKKDFPNRELTDSQIVELARANVGPTKIYNNITDVAKEISTYYQSGVKFNNDKVKFSNYGMKDQEDYNVSLDNKKVDLTSYKSIMQQLLLKQRQEQFSDQTFGRLPGVN